MTSTRLSFEIDFSVQNGRYSLDKEAFFLLQERFNQQPQEDYPVHSRVHLLKTIGSKRCYVKRDDELGFGISGTKFRKYRTLIPYLLKESFEEIVIIGGAYSNHVLAMTQLLIENGIKPILFLKGPQPSSAKGNFLFLKMLVAEASFHWVSKADWDRVEELAHEFAATRKKAFVLPEGGTIFAAFLGSISLPLDILKNEEVIGKEFDHLFIEVGTGYSAAALLLVYAYLKKKTFCHLLLSAGNKEEFLEQLKRLHADFEKWLGQSCPFPIQFACEAPLLAPSFGSTNATLFSFLISMAREEGFFLDPIYSGKLMFHAKTKIEQEPLLGDALVIHSGGALALSGFQESLESRMINL